VLDALRASSSVGEICVVGAEEVLAPAVGDRAVTYRPADDNPLGSFLTGLRVFQSSQEVLVTAADLPLLTGPIVDAFIDACGAAPTGRPENLYISVVRREDFIGPFARTHKAINRFRDGVYGHGNLALADPRILRNAAAMERINAMYAARKSELRSALALGLSVGLAYVIGVHFLHLLTLRQMAAIASRRFGIGLVPVTLPHPEVAVDVDEPEDFEVASELLA
jgi:CTP:molybdopterin cytidylyltransferase MocA